MLDPSATQATNGGVGRTRIPRAPHNTTTSRTGSVPVERALVQRVRSQRIRAVPAAHELRAPLRRSGPRSKPAGNGLEAEDGHFPVNVPVVPSSSQPRVGPTP